MKIAVFGSYAPSLINFRGPLLQAMVNAGHNVVGLAPEDDLTIRKKLQALGVEYKPVPLRRTGLNPIHDLVCIENLVQAFKTLKPDLLLSYTVKPVVYGSLAAAYAGIPKRYSMITGLGSSLRTVNWKTHLTSHAVKLLYRGSLSFNHGVFFQNPDDMNFFTHHRLIAPNCPKILIHGSGVDLDYFQYVPLKKTPLTFLMIARLTRDKGVFEYIEAARILKAQYPHVRCCLLGPFDSNPNAISREQVQAWQREGVVEYQGETDDVRPFLMEAHIFVLPSYGEGTPRSVLEAMAMGRAVITTQVAGCKETVLHEKTGFLVPAQEALALAKAMQRFVMDPQLVEPMGLEGRTYAEQKYDVHQVNQVILQTLRLFK